MNKMIFAITSFFISIQMLAFFGGGGVITVNSETELNGVIKGNNYVVVQFRNPKCPHCISFTKAGTFKKLAREYPQIHFVEINSNKASSSFKKRGITSTPTFVYFQGGKKVHQMSGTSDIGYYEEEIERYFGLSSSNGNGMASQANEPVPQGEESMDIDNE